MFVSPDHPLVADSIELLVNSDKGVTGFSLLEGDVPGLSVEAVFVLETVALSHLQVDRFLSPAPIRVVVDLRGSELTGERDMAWAKTFLESGDLNRFLERPGFSREFLEAMLGGAEDVAEKTAKRLKTTAKTAAKKALGAEIQRLEDLRKINENVRPEEVAIAKSELQGVLDAVDAAGLRLDSFRVVVEGEIEDLRKV